MGSRTDDRDTQESWLRLLFQPRELTHRGRVWNHLLLTYFDHVYIGWLKMRPKFTALLDQRRDIIKQNREKRKSELLTHYRNFLQGSSAYLVNRAAVCLVDLFEIPLVSNMIERNDCSAEITKESWQRIENRLQHIKGDHRHKTLYDCARLMRAVRETPDEIVCLDEKTSESSGDDPTLDYSAVGRHYAFFSSPTASWNMVTFGQIMDDRRANMLKTQSYPPWKSLRLQVERLAVQTADALASSLGLPSDTEMYDVESFGSTFVCLQCESVLRNPLTWRGLVNLF